MPRPHILRLCYLALLFLVLSLPNPIARILCASHAHSIPKTDGRKVDNSAPSAASASCHVYVPIRSHSLILGWDHVNMPGANEQQRHSLSVREEFRSLLESQWTRQVACQNVCPIDSCSCQRNIVHVHAVESWWKKQASESPNNTKLDRFVHGMPVSPHRILPIRPTRISTSGKSCLRVLSLLLKQERDHLIDRFYMANMYDHFLTRSESDENLRENLVGVVHHAEVETIIGDFHKEKWKWCPLNLTLDMDENLHGTKVIPPFCLKTKLSEKGGTASIYWVAVQKDLISDNALALALQDSIYTDDEFGEVSFPPRRYHSKLMPSSVIKWF